MKKKSSKLNLKLKIRKFKKSRKSRKYKRQKAGANNLEKQKQYKSIWNSIKNNKKPLSQAQSLNNLVNLTQKYQQYKNNGYDLFDIIFKNQIDITELKTIEPSLYFDHKHGSTRMTAGIKGIHIYVAFKKNTDNKINYKIIGVILNNN